VRRVTVDSNIFISALKFGGKPLQLLNLARRGEIEIAISEAILDEFLGVLRDKFHWSAGRLADAREEVMSFTKLVEPKQTLDVVKADPDDNRIVECAVESGSEKIITHDNDLLRMKEYNGIKMMKVHEFLREGPERGR
jgi:putative PIN family toxin of toxin-antitoxin system